MTRRRPPILKEGRWVFALKDLRYSSVFPLLFSHPKLAYGLLTLRPFWAAPICLTLLVALLGGILLTMSTLPEYGRDIRQGTQFVLDTVGSTALRNGQVSWEEDKNAALPASTSLPHLHLDLTERWTDFAPSRKHPQNQGIVLCKDGVGYWERNADGQITLLNLVLPAQKFAQIQDDSMQLTRTRQGSACRGIFLVLFGSLSAMNFFLLLKMMASTTFVMTIVWLFLGHVRSIRAYGRFLLLSLNMALPPFLVSLFWSLCGIPGGMETLFTFAFFLYIIYAFVEARNGQFISAR